MPTTSAKTSFFSICICKYTNHHQCIHFCNSFIWFYKISAITVSPVNESLLTIFVKILHKATLNNRLYSRETYNNLALIPKYLKIYFASSSSKNLFSRILIFQYQKHFSPKICSFSHLILVFLLLTLSR